MLLQTRQCAVEDILDIFIRGAGAVAVDELAVGADEQEPGDGVDADLVAEVGMV